MSVEDAVAAIMLDRPPARLDSRKRRYSWAYHKALNAAAALGLERDNASSVARIKARRIAGGGELA